MKIQIKLKNLIRSDEAIKELGLNPWCVNEGADGNEYRQVSLEQAIKWGFIKHGTNRENSNF
jgi:hypothetical protein